MWTDFLTILVFVLGIAVYFQYEVIRRKKFEFTVEAVQTLEKPYQMASAEIEQLRKELKLKTEELENIRSQSTQLWQENVRLREVQLVTSDRGMMTMVEEWIEQRDEQNRQTMAALGYQSMHKNDLDNAFGIQPISPYITGKGLDKTPPSLPSAPIEAERSGAEPLPLELRDVQRDYIDLLSGGESGAETTCLYCGHVRRLHVPTGCKAEECQVLDGFECDGFVSE